MNKTRNIEVCVTPEMVDVYGVENKIVVVVDVLRATSCMVTALAHGVKSIIPVATVEECRALKNQGYLAAAERDGKTVEGFDLGNSPFTYMEKQFQGKTIAVTTTNGTKAINRSLKADEIIVGSFLNISAVAQYLIQQPKDVVILCAGWKNKLNLEDTLFGGAIVERLKEVFFSDNDSAIMANTIYNVAKKDMLGFLSNSSHARRLKGLNITKDIEFCLTEDLYSVVPVMRQHELVCMEMELVGKNS